MMKGGLSIKLPIKYQNPTSSKSRDVEQDEEISYFLVGAVRLTCF